MTYSPGALAASTAMRAFAASTVSAVSSHRSLPSFSTLNTSSGEIIHPAPHSFRSRPYITIINNFSVRKTTLSSVVTNPTAAPQHPDPVAAGAVASHPAMQTKPDKAPQPPRASPLHIALYSFSAIRARSSHTWRSPASDICLSFSSNENFPAPPRPPTLPFRRPGDTHNHDFGARQ